MSASDFKDVGLLKQSAINLLYNWGFNYYSKEEQLRADDLLIRSKVGWLLGAARKSVDLAERAYRRDNLPPPSRAKPRHDPAAIAGAQTLERLSHAVGKLQGHITAQPVPSNDRMIQRHLQEAATLKKLLEWDEILIAQADLLRAKLDQKDGIWLLENESLVHEGLDAITESLRNRQLVLLPFT